MLERDGVRPWKFANQRLITGSDGQGLPMTCSLGCARGSTNGSCRRSLAWPGCKLPRGSDVVFPVLPHLRSDLEGFSWPHCPYQPLIQPLCSQSTPANPEWTIWTGVAASFSREMGPSRLGGWPGSVTGRVHVHVVMAMEKSNAMRVYQSCVSRAHGRYTSKKPPPGGFSFLTSTFLSGLYPTTVAQWVS